MNDHKTWYGILFIAGLLLTVSAGLFVSAPGYMDADYYYAGSILLATGKGFQQPYIWNYLDQPTGLPTPAFTYWMPLVSIAGAAGYALFHSFTGSRILLWLVAALISPLTYRIGLKLHGKHDIALIGGLFALFPAYYSIFLTGTDSFALYMVIASLFLLTATANVRVNEIKPFLLGVLAGGLHMTRADGGLWMAAGIIWVICSAWNTSEPKLAKTARACLGGLLSLAGYGVVTSAWYVRNLMEYHRLFPPGGNLSVWFTRYEDLFVYPWEIINPQRWMATGLTQIISIWWQAFMANLQTSIAVQASIALFPFILIGLISWRHSPMIRLGIGLWVLTFLIFTIAFPFAGINGSFFHSGAAVQPLLWAVAPLGIVEVVNRIAGWRKWERGLQVQQFLATLLVIVCVLLSGGLFSQHLAGNENTGMWGEGQREYIRIERDLQDHGATPCEIVMVNNPPGYYLASGRSAIVIPYGDEEMVKAAAFKFGARYLILDRNNSGHLSRLYLEPGTYPGLQYQRSIGSTRIYEFIP